MADAVRDTVHFRLTVQSIEHDGHWTTRALETGVITAGATRDEAERKSGAAHVMLVRRIKQEGLAALDAYLTARGISYELGDPPHREPAPALANESVEQLPIAA
ncbi:MAG: hypothetical protein F4Z77_06620 [Dehalococcoidia bacterium]|nr:hypothetical protein [Chloroflexota bacterium]MXW25947.1 hypothetical protein [Dehalococcoidia bacterium]MYA54053.1 hypothetical protein [Dehalococcoidia bacterium]